MCHCLSSVPSKVLRGSGESVYISRMAGGGDSVKQQLTVSEESRENENKAFTCMFFYIVCIFPHVKGN